MELDMRRWKKEIKTDIKVKAERKFVHKNNTAEKSSTSYNEEKQEIIQEIENTWLKDNWEKEKTTKNFSCIILTSSNSMKSLREREGPMWIIYPLRPAGSQISELSPPICFDIYTNRYWITVATQGNFLQCMQVSNENNKQ